MAYASHVFFGVFIGVFFLGGRSFLLEMLFIEELKWSSMVLSVSFI